MMEAALVRLYRLALRSFPEAFRTLHGEVMERTFRDILAEARSRSGVWGMLITGLIECGDVLARGGRERMATNRPATTGGAGGMETTFMDLKLALRSLARRPGFTAAIVVTLALGIGANTAIFTVVDQILLRPLPFPEPDRLVRVWPTRGGRPEPRAFSVPDFEDWAEASDVTSAMGLFTTLPSDLVLQGEGPAEEVRTAFVSPGFLRVLAVAPVLGRLPDASDVEADPFAVVLTHGTWVRRFGADPTIAGRTVVLSDRAYRVAAVLPRGAAFPGHDVEVFTFLSTIPTSSIPLELRVVRILDAVARLEPGVTADAAEERLAAVAAALGERHPETNDTRDGAIVEPLRATLVGDVRTPLLVLAGAVALILLLACANVANLLLVRGRDRAPEMAVRTALGAGRGRLVRQLLVEHLALAFLGGAAGVLLATIGVGALQHVALEYLPRTYDPLPDGRVLAFAVALTSLTGVLFGLAPARRAARGHPAAELRAARSRVPAGGALVAVQAALALVLVVGAALAARSLAKLGEVDPGFEADGLLAVHLTAPASRYDQTGYLAYQEALTERFRRLPGVTAVASIRHLPLRGAGERREYQVPGRPTPDGETLPEAHVIQVTPGALETLGVPLRAGRPLRPEDSAEGLLRIVINESLAREAWAGEGAPGRRLVVLGVEAEVVGIAADVRHVSLDAPAPPVVYVPQSRIPRREFTFLLRTSGDALALAAPARDVVADLDAAQAITEIGPAGHAVREALGRPRFLGGLLAAFALLALGLATLGIYAVVSQEVGRRSREIGIRRALGADRRRTVGMVVRQGMTPVLAGTLIGAVSALLLSRLAERLLFEVEPLDPTSHATGAAALLLAGLAAAWLPARRAARIDPAKPLREV